MKIDERLEPRDLRVKVQGLWQASAPKIRSIEASYKISAGAPVFTVKGIYTSRGWTEWTQGFQFGSALLQYDATGEREFLELGRSRSVSLMAPHLTHMGVHDHGFNNVSTYGNLLRLAVDGRTMEPERDRDYCSLALRVSGAVQAQRWTTIPQGGFIYSFNGPHSLFIDTIRSLRVLAISHMLGHVLIGENDRRVSLLERLVQHARTTATYSVYYGEGRDVFDVRGRTAHESIFDVNDGNYRCPSTQQGYSPFTTWTRGLAWAILGFAELLEFLETRTDEELQPPGARRQQIETFMRRAAMATCDFYVENTPADGIPYWDTGAPGLLRLGDYLGRPAEPFNDYEPVDSPAAAIASQGFLRLGHYLNKHGGGAEADRYWKAGLTILKTLFDEPYLSRNAAHQGLILHSVYHRPNGWDYVPDGRKVPCGESSMWGDYHAREVALYLQRVMDQGKYLTFWG